MLNCYEVRSDSLPWRLAVTRKLQKWAAEWLVAAMPQQRPCRAQELRQFLKQKSLLVERSELKDLFFC